MLYALRHPLALLALVLGFLVGITVRGVVQGALARRFGDRSAAASGRSPSDPRRHLDPFGAVAAAIGGVGWGQPRPQPFGTRRDRGRQVTLLLAGPVAMAVVGAVLLAAYVAVGGPRIIFDIASVSDYVRGDVVVPDNAGYTFLLLAGVELIAMALLDLVPLPPLDGGRLLFLLGPKTIGWQKAEYQLAERNIGLAIVLVLLILPLGGNVPLLLFVIDAILDPLLSLVSG